MDKETIRILNTISSSIGDSLSINQLTNRIKDTYGSAYYANIYQKMQELKNEGLLDLEPIGRSSSVKLNFNNYLLIDNLAEIEIEKKLDFLSKKKSLLSLLADMDEILTVNCSIKSVTAVNPLKNVKLNRVEFLFLIRKTADYLHQTVELSEKMLNLERKYNLKINSLILDEHDFVDLLISDEVNPVREALSQQIALYNPQAFWSQIKETAQKSQIRTLATETKPLNISDSDLTFNLNRFGYSEFGASFIEGTKFCIEYIASSLLIREEARGIDSVAVILTKNNFNCNLLAFLSQKYEVSPRLLGILRILQRLKQKPELNKTVKILETINSKELPADEKSIQEKLELYNAL